MQFDVQPVIPMAINSIGEPSPPVVLNLINPVVQLYVGATKANGPPVVGLPQAVVGGGGVMHLQAASAFQE